MTGGIPRQSAEMLEQLQSEAARVRAFLDELGIRYDTKALADGGPCFHVARPPLKLLQLFPLLDVSSRAVVWQGWGVLGVGESDRSRLLGVANTHNVTRSDSVLVALPDGLGCRLTRSIRVVGHVRGLLDGIAADLEEAAAAS